MKVVRVHNPGGLRATKTRRRTNTMAKRRRKTNTRRRTVARANPRRHRRRVHRRRNPSIVAAPRARRRRAVSNPRHRRRHHHRRRNPSGMRIGQIFKDMVYGAAGAIGTRVVANVVGGFVPAAFASSPLAGPVVEAAVAVTVVRWGGKKFMGQQQGDLMMLGGLISAGLKLADQYFPNIQTSLGNIIRLPVAVAPAAAPALAGYRDVYDVPDSAFAGLRGFGDVEDVPMNIFDGYGG